MAKITDPDNLTYELNTVAAGTANVVVDTAAKLIELNTGASLSDDGLTVQSLYSKLKEIWKNEPLAIPYDFPMEAITPEQFEFRQGWELAAVGSINLLRDGGFAYKPLGGGASTAEWIGLDSVFALNSNLQSGGDQIYIELDEPNGTVLNTYITGQANQPVQVYGDGTHGSIDYRSNNLRFFCREQGKDFAFSSVSALNVSLPLTYKKYAFPLSNSLDSKINGQSGLQDTDIATGGFPNAPDSAPFSGMSITTDGAPYARNIGGTSYNFDIIIDANNATAEQVYAFVQYQLRRATDVEAGVDTLNGETADELLTFVGDTLYTIQDRNGRGVYIDNFDTNDTNRLVFVDNTGTERTFPYVAAGSIQFNTNLVNDTAARYWMFFENDDAGANTGRDFGTDLAMIVHANAAVNKDGSGGADFTFTNGTPSTITTTTLDLSVFADGDVVHVEGSTSNDGYYLISGAPTATAMNIKNLDGTDVTITSESGLAGTEIAKAITGEVSGSSSITWDFDWDNNDQRGNGAPAAAPVVVVAIGLNTGQYVRTPTSAEGGNASITQAVGQTISLTAALERNYSNP